MRSLLVQQSGTHPATSSYSPMRRQNDYHSVTKLHRSIARYLNSQAERSMFRDNTLIDPHVQSMKETKERYVSPYNRGILGDISSQNHIPSLKLNVNQTSVADHKQRIALVDKNVLNVQCRKDAIGYFAKKFDRQSKMTNQQHQQSLSQLLSLQQDSVLTRRNNMLFNSTHSNQVVVKSNRSFESRSLSRDQQIQQSDRRENKENSVSRRKQLGSQQSLKHHEKLSKNVRAAESSRGTFMRFMNHGDSNYSARQIEEQQARLARCEHIGSQSAEGLPTLNMMIPKAQSRRESKKELNSGLGMLNQWASQENSREHSREKKKTIEVQQAQLSKKISQSSFEDINLHSSHQYLEAPPSIITIGKKNYKHTTQGRVNESQFSKLFPSIVATSISYQSDSRNKPPQYESTKAQNAFDILELEEDEDMVTPKASANLLLGSNSTAVITNKPVSSLFAEPTLLEHQKTAEQRVPYDKYGSIVAKNMMKLQKRYRSDLDSSKNGLIGTKSTRVLLPLSKKLTIKGKKSQKLTKVNLVGDIEQAYGKTFGKAPRDSRSIREEDMDTRIANTVERLTETRAGTIASTASINRELNSLKNSIGAIQKSSMTTAASNSNLGSRKMSHVLVQIRNELHNRHKKVQKQLTMTKSKEGHQPHQPLHIIKRSMSDYSEMRVRG